MKRTRIASLLMGTLVTLAVASSQPRTQDVLRCHSNGCAFRFLRPNGWMTPAEKHWFEENAL